MVKSIAVLAGIMLVAAASQARATVSFCNHAKSQITVAIAHTPKDAPGTSTGGDLGTTAEGWWKIAPGTCAEVSDIHAGNNWLYYMATSKDGAIEGTSWLCVSKKAFTIGQQFHRQGDRCKPGQYLAGFKRENTAAANHVVNIH